MVERQPASERLLRTVERQSRELEQLQEALRSRELIDIAKGALVERFGYTPEEAFAELRRLSQETNTKLVRVASALVAQASAQREQRFDELNEDVLADPETRRRIVRAREFPWARAHLAGTLIRSAGSAKEMATVLCEEGLGAAAAVIMSLDADGGLTLLGEANLLPEEVSQWHRVPSLMDTYMTRVAKARHAILLSQPQPETDIPLLGVATGLHGAHAVLPLLVGGHLIGVAELVWREPRGFSRAERHHLALLADHVARSLRDDWEQLGSETLLPEGSSALQALLDTLLDSTIVLSAVRENGQPIDFLIDYANELAVDVSGRGAEDLVGRRFLELYPTHAQELFDAFVQILETGAPYRSEAAPMQTMSEGVLVIRSVTIRASRFFDGVLVSWRILDDGERDSQK